MDKYLRLSVHQLVDFLLRKGDIDNRVFNRETMNEGSRIHSSYQSQQDDNYSSEVFLSHEFHIDDVTVLLEGRADGVIKRNDEYIIDEIKTTVSSLEEYKEENIEWHLGQAKCYALMLAYSLKLENVGVKLTYIRQGNEKDKLIITYKFDISTLEQDVKNLLDDYLDFYQIIFRSLEERKQTIQRMDFPFLKYRQGQRELAKYAYGTCKNGGRLFVEAPTGIGKTMSTLFPYIKYMAEDEKSKVFYLTAKTSGQDSAYNAVELLKSKGLSIKDIVLTAKEKICFCKGKGCNPDDCPFAKGYYRNVQSVLRYALVSYSSFDYQTITHLAYTNSICPFEFQLDLSLFCDVIICDYNYLFDPVSYLKRFFDEDASHFLVLVDEAHNLVDRSRDMYSMYLSYDGFLKARDSIKHANNLTRLKRCLSKVNKMFKDDMTLFKEGQHVVPNLDEVNHRLELFVKNIKEIMGESPKEITKEITDFYLDAMRFNRIYSIMGDSHIAMINRNEKNLCYDLVCLDASKYLHSISSRLKAVTYFSGTFSPLDYYMDILGGEKGKDPNLLLPSPFPIDNLSLIVAPNISIKYKNRESSYQKVSEYIECFIKNKIGNYFIYSPSYEYQNKLLENLSLNDVNYYVQTKEMNDKDKSDFLDNFIENPPKTTLGFIVIGGAFSEGIDMINDRLIGAVIIGIGMPKINYISDQIADYYEENGLAGHDYAYLYPGMNKVMQAVGRVIRSETDKGAVLLIDERYLYRQYLKLFKDEWKHYKVAFSKKDIEEILLKFYK